MHCKLCCLECVALARANPGFQGCVCVRVSLQARFKISCQHCCSETMTCTNFKQVQPVVLFFGQMWCACSLTMGRSSDPVIKSYRLTVDSAAVQAHSAETDLVVFFGCIWFGLCSLMSSSEIALKCECISCGCELFVRWMDFKII